VYVMLMRRMMMMINLHVCYVCSCVYISSRCVYCACRCTRMCIAACMGDVHVCACACIRVCRGGHMHAYLYVRGYVYVRVTSAFCIRLAKMLLVNAHYSYIDMKPRDLLSHIDMKPKDLLSHIDIKPKYLLKHIDMKPIDLWSRKDMTHLVAHGRTSTYEHTRMHIHCTQARTYPCTCTRNTHIVTRCIHTSTNSTHDDSSSSTSSSSLKHTRSNSS